MQRNWYKSWSGTVSFLRTLPKFRSETILQFHFPINVCVSVLLGGDLDLFYWQQTHLQERKQVSLLLQRSGKVEAVCNQQWKLI